MNMYAHVTVHSYKNAQICIYTYSYSHKLRVKIKTHDSSKLRLTIVSREAKKEAGRTRRTNVLFTGSTALKLVNALNKPP